MSSFTRLDPAEQQERRAAERAATNMAPFTATLRPVTGAVMGGTTTGPVPKGEKAKPGKRTPTRDEARWMAQITAFGCIACHFDGFGYVPAEVHHLLRGGVRMGHLHTIPLCSGHHRKGAGMPGLIARHPDKAAFEAQYGSEQELLGWLRGEIGGTP